MIIQHINSMPSKLGYLDPEDQLDIIEHETRRGLLNEIYNKFVKDIKVECLEDEDGNIYYSAMCDCIIIPLTTQLTDKEDGNAKADQPHLQQGNDYAKHTEGDEDQPDAETDH